MPIAAAGSKGGLKSKVLAARSSEPRHEFVKAPWVYQSSVFPQDSGLFFLLRS